MKRITVYFFLIIVFLCGCGMFDRTVVVESDYPLPARKDTITSETVTVNDLSDLREAIRSAVAGEGKNFTILFDSAYNGNPAEDLAAACWQVRTEDALCAYCVENIVYELSQIVAYTEAKITVTYSPLAIPVKDIVTMPYATALNDRIGDAISSGKDRLAILINRSTLTAEDMISSFEAVYCQHPGLAPRQPEVSVSVFSGSGTQRLYEIGLNTGLSAEDFETRKAEMDRIQPPVEEEDTELQAAYQCASILRDRCNLSAPNTIYDALVGESAGPEGIALAYVELCSRAGLDCLLVKGQKDWQDHCWNMVSIDGNYYHVDLFADEEHGLFKDDTSFWGSYRWTVNDYPKCSSRLDPSLLAELNSEALEVPAENGESEEPPVLNDEVPQP